jgi:hypothetical protein
MIETLFGEVDVECMVNYYDFGLERVDSLVVVMLGLFYFRQLRSFLVYT